MQELDFVTKKPLQKEKNWDNFLVKWSNLSNARLEGIEITSRQFNEYCIESYGKTEDEIIKHIKNFDDDQKYELITDLLQEWINHHMVLISVVSRIMSSKYTLAFKSKPICGIFS